MIPDIGATARTVEVTIDAIRRIANTTLPNAETDATNSTHSFRNLAVDAGAFGGHPLAKELAHQHTGAHEVFVETIDGVLKDLEEFAQKLRESMDGHENNDDAIAAMLLNVSKKYDGHRYHSDLANEQARTDQAHNLTTSKGGTGTAPAYDGGVPPTTPTVPPTTKPVVGPSVDYQ